MNSSFSNYKFRKILDGAVNFIIAAICVYAVALILLPSLFFSYEFLWDDYQSKSKILFASFITLNIVKYLNHLTINSERDKELLKRTLFYSTFAILFFIERFINDDFKIFIYAFTMGLLALLGLR